MIANFFQSLKNGGVEYLLISGQATVLYGAATFSEDIDIWLKPTAGNLDRFIEALRASSARYYKLTPAISETLLTRGHGFHFTLPDPDAGTAFLDVMGAPPRVGCFDDSAGESRWIPTEWGDIRTIGIRQLIELKKTQRLADYPIIGRLVSAWFEQAAGPSSAGDFSWAFENLFALDDLHDFVDRQPTGLPFLAGHSDPVFRNYGQQLVSTGQPLEPAEEALASLLQRRMTALQRADRLYWQEIIGELKKLRADGNLVSEGTLV